MSELCQEIHKLFKQQERHQFPFNEQKIPRNGIYILFEQGEMGHQGDRIVRIGTHTGDNQLRSRLKQHFIRENKDRSIFRKNIGRAILNQTQDPFLEHWELDLTTRAAKEKYQDIINFDKQAQIEKQVTSYIQNNFTFVVFEVISKAQRLELESRIISTVSWCDECFPSNTWLGAHSPKEKIRKSGLWLVNELYKQELSENDVVTLQKLVG